MCVFSYHAWRVVLRDFNDGAVAVLCRSDVEWQPKVKVPEVPWSCP